MFLGPGLRFAHPGMGGVSSLCSKSTPARRFDHEHVAGAHVCLRRRTERFNAAVLALNPIDARGAGFAAGQAVRRDGAAVGQYCGGHRRTKANAADGAVAAAVGASAAGISPDAELLNQNRKAALQHFGIGEAGVGHVGMDGVAPRAQRPAARPALPGGY